ncbi:MAG TPA: DNRLRE domain-containing protein [Terriglobales bacterium]|nr:DNRLRE domain-containing protein [Terriglobales bacterium]
MTPFLFHGVSWAQEATTLATSAADATIDQANPNTNFGAGTTLGTAGSATAGLVQRSVVRFDLSTLANQGVAVKAATLNMTLTDPPSAGRTIEVHNLTTPFTEGTVTWNSPWTTAGGDFGASLITTGSGTTRSNQISWTDTAGTLAAAVTGWFTNNTGFLLKDQTETSNSLAAIAHVQTVTGNVNTTTTATVTTSSSITAQDGNVYVAAIASTNNRPVQSVTGPAGLTWTAVEGQASDDFLNRIELWKATGTPTANGTVTATFGSNGAQGIIVSRYTGVNPDSPIGALASTDSAGAATGVNLNFNTIGHNSVPIGATAEANGVTFTVGANYTADADTGAAGTTEGVELERRAALATPTNGVAVNGTLSLARHWALIGAELLQEMAPRWASRESTVTGNPPTLDLTYDRAPTGMTMVPRAGTPGVSEVTVSWGFGGACSNNNVYRGSYFTQDINGGAGSATSPIADGNGAPNAGRVGSTSEVVIFQQNGGNPCATTFSVENGFNAAQGSSATGGDVIVLAGQSNSFTGFAFDNQFITGSAAGANHYSNGVVVTGTTNTGGGTTKLWSYKTAATTFAAPGLTASGVVVTAGNDSKLHSVSDSTGGRDYLPGTVVGTDPGALGGAVQSRPPVIPRDVLEVGNPCANTCDVAYVGAGDGRVYAFRTDTGAQLWQSAVLVANASIQGAAAVQLVQFSSGLAHDTVIVGTHCNTCGSNVHGNAIVALRGDTGAELWRCNTASPGGPLTPCGNMDIISSTPVIDYASNNVWVTSRSNGGTQPSVWRVNTTNGSKVAGITLAGGTSTDVDASPSLSYTNSGGSSSPPAFLYVLTGASGANGDLRVVDPSSNTVVATTPALGGSGVANAFPLPFYDGTQTGCDDVYFATGGTTKGVHRRTFKRSSPVGFGASPCNFANNSWDRTATIGATPSNPIDNGFPSPTALYFGSGDGHIHKIKTSDGTDAAGTASVTVNAGSQLGDISLDGIKNQLYIGDAAGRIYGFQSF